MAHLPHHASRADCTAADMDSTDGKSIGVLICEFIGGLMKVVKPKQAEKITPVVENLGKYMEELVGSVEGKRLITNIKQLASQIKSKETFFAVLWRMFHVARHICTKGSARFGLFFMGAALLLFLVSTVTGVTEGLLAVWFTLAARTFAHQLLSSGSNLMRNGVKETVPNKQTFVNFLNSIACGTGQEHEQVSREEIQQLEARCATATTCCDRDWVLM
jgi:hypothetical protein